MHATRDSKKEKNLIVSDTDLASFPQANASRKIDLYYDSRTGSFTYTEGESEYVVHPNYEIKMPEGKRKLVNFITASKVIDKYEFRMKEYKKIR